ncbi:MAG TPA: MFS transporter, partial [Symbiobacteriaceae bacterium]|nr:MFS transporter [Symbiobacteriaceae bacterium]
MLQRQRTPHLLLLIMASSFLLNLSFSFFRSVFSNFAVQELAISATQYGWLEGIREVPGLATVLLVAMAARLNDERLYTVSGALIGIGLWLYASAHSYADLIVATLVQSIGFHVWTVVQDSLVMHTVSTGDRAAQLGRVNSVAAAATLIGMGVVSVLGAWLGLRHFFIVGGLAGLAGALI